jgi:hypothetical protein
VSILPKHRFACCGNASIDASMPVVGAGISAAVGDAPDRMLDA